MNYAVAFLALIIGGSTIYWYIVGKKHYTGPLIETNAEDSASRSGDSVTVGDSTDRKNEKVTERAT